MEAPLMHLALVGTPNSGKTSLFNALTGSRQKVANYPGVTVERKEGSFVTPLGRQVSLVDLPGTYSLRGRSPDEEITRDVVLGRTFGEAMPDLDDPRIMRAMNEMERDMAHMDENNPKHMAQMMRKMKDILPPGSMPKEVDVAIKRLEAGEDMEKIEADMGDVLGGLMGGEEGAGGRGGGYSHDSGLYDY